jgi:hypothetical protein
MLTMAIRLDLIVHRERGTEVMDGDVERRFAVFLQLHCTVKVEVERGIFNQIHNVARLGQRAKSADFERSTALGIARSVVTHRKVRGGGGVTHKVRSSI